MWEPFKEITSDRYIKSDNWLNVFDLNISFVSQTSDVMLPISTGLKNSCASIPTETDVQKHLSLNSSKCARPD